MLSHSKHQKKKYKIAKIAFEEIEKMIEKQLAKFSIIHGDIICMVLFLSSLFSNI
jgi:hypothetical protein